MFDTTRHDTTRQVNKKCSHRSDTNPTQHDLLPPYSNLVNPVIYRIQFVGLVQFLSLTC